MRRRKLLVEDAEELGQIRGNKNLFFMHLFTSELYLTSKVDPRQTVKCGDVELREEENKLSLEQ